MTLLHIKRSKKDLFKNLKLYVNLFQFYHNSKIKTISIIEKLFTFFVYTSVMSVNFAQGLNYNFSDLYDQFDISYSINKNKGKKYVIKIKI